MERIPSIAPLRQRQPDANQDASHSSASPSSTSSSSSTSSAFFFGDDSRGHGARRRPTDERVDPTEEDEGARLPVDPSLGSRASQGTGASPASPHLTSTSGGHLRRQQSHLCRSGKRPRSHVRGRRRKPTLGSRISPKIKKMLTWWVFKI